MFKTLVADVGGQLVVAARSSGYVVGGISPNDLRTITDARTDALAH